MSNFFNREVENFRKQKKNYREFILPIYSKVELRLERQFSQKSQSH